MATLVIKDLPENVELDREAMLAVVGGARTRGQPALAGRGAFRSALPASLFTGLPLLNRQKGNARQSAPGTPLR